MENLSSYSNGHENTTATADENTYKLKAIRSDLQLARRLFHMLGASAIATLYALFLSHQQVIYILGSIACIFYIFEQIRVNYPRFANKIYFFTRYLYRAEEQLRESTMVAMFMGILLTILSFPKSIAITAIFTLAVSDPLSAIIGIKFGKHAIFKRKTLEGSMTFFAATFTITLATFGVYNNNWNAPTWLLALLCATGVTIFEMIPLKIDDNLTIPLATAFWLWPLCLSLGVPT